MQTQLIKIQLKTNNLKKKFFIKKYSTVTKMENDSKKGKSDFLIKKDKTKNKN